MIPSFPVTTSFMTFLTVLLGIGTLEGGIGHVLEPEYAQANLRKTRNRNSRG